MKSKISANCSGQIHQTMTVSFTKEILSTHYLLVFIGPNLQPEPTKMTTMCSFLTAECELPQGYSTAQIPTENTNDKTSVVGAPVGIFQQRRTLCDPPAVVEGALKKHQYYTEKCSVTGISLYLVKVPTVKVSLWLFWLSGLLHRVTIHKPERLGND